MIHNGSPYRFCLCVFSFYRINCVNVFFTDVLYFQLLLLQLKYRIRTDNWVYFSVLILKTLGTLNNVKKLHDYYGMSIIGNHKVGYLFGFCRDNF